VSAEGALRKNDALADLGSRRIMFRNRAESDCTTNSLNKETVACAVASDNLDHNFISTQHHSLTLHPKMQRLRIPFANIRTFSSILRAEIAY
jgi:hypothetical protein